MGRDRPKLYFGHHLQIRRGLSTRRSARGSNPLCGAPVVICAWHDEWDDSPAAERARLKAAHGAAYPVLDGLVVQIAPAIIPVAADGAWMGEVMMRGNVVMKGYFKNPDATKAALTGGRFSFGDLGVMHLMAISNH